MFGLPPWALAVIWRIAAPLLVTLLRKLGAINAAEALAARTVVAIKNLKTYREYPDDPPDQTNTHNFTVGKKPGG